MLDLARSLLFIHIPKTGGVSIQDAMAAYMTNETMYHGAAVHLAGHLSVVPNCRLSHLPFMANSWHLTDSMARAVLRECHNITKPIDSFAIIREPVARQLSAYKWLADGGYKKSFDEYISSRDFLRVPRDNGNFVSTFAMPQHMYTTAMTKMFTLEGEMWLPFLQSRYPGIRIPHYNRGMVQSTSVSDAARQVVEQYYADDIRMWQKVRQAEIAATGNHFQPF